MLQMALPSACWRFSYVVGVLDERSEHALVTVPVARAMLEDALRSLWTSREPDRLHAQAVGALQEAAGWNERLALNGARCRYPQVWTDPLLKIASHAADQTSVENEPADAAGPPDLRALVEWFAGTDFQRDSPLIDLPLHIARVVLDDGTHLNPFGLLAACNDEGVADDRYTALVAHVAAAALATTVIHVAMLTGCASENWATRGVGMALRVASDAVAVHGLVPRYAVRAVGGTQKDPVSPVRLPKSQPNLPATEEQPANHLLPLVRERMTHLIQMLENDLPLDCLTPPETFTSYLAGKSFVATTRLARAAADPMGGIAAASAARALAEEAGRWWYRLGNPDEAELVRRHRSFGMSLGTLRRRRRQALHADGIGRTQSAFAVFETPPASIDHDRALADLRAKGAQVELPSASAMMRAAADRSGAPWLPGAYAILSTAVHALPAAVAWTMEFDGEDLTVGADEIPAFEALCADIASWSTALLVPLLFGFLLRDLHVRQQRWARDLEQSALELHQLASAIHGLEPIQHPPVAGGARNQPCPCGSGFKAKFCPNRLTAG
jgi:hypothetical protein